MYRSSGPNIGSNPRYKKNQPGVILALAYMKPTHIARGNQLFTHQSSISRLSYKLKEKRDSSKLHFGSVFFAQPKEITWTSLVEDTFLIGAGTLNLFSFQS